MDEQPYQPKPHRFIFFAGVVMPAISITLEATTHICAEFFFDPIPTVWHLLLVVFVPLAQLQVWFAIRKGAPDRLALAGIANAIVIAISIFYSIVYVPLLPLAALTVPIGLGILPLAPYLSLLAALLMRYYLKRIAATAQQKSFAVAKTGLLASIAFTVVAIGLIELPGTLTRIGLQKAASSSPQTRSEGIRFLRSYGNQDLLLRNCYSHTGWATDLIGYILSFENPVTTDEARKIYYRVTGEPFHERPAPQKVGGRFTRDGLFDVDSAQGTEDIGSKLEGLSLSSSKLDGSVDADGGVGYLQWTLVFQNDSDMQRESRAQVQLPPGAVVSRLTLWVNGEEREAAFAGRTQVREAYQQVAIRQRRDPVLVTTAGRDRIMVQCFPVPPGSEMKIRVGITVPLMLEDRMNARLLLPHFASRNFDIPDHVTHSVWIESRQYMMTANEALKMDLTAADLFALRGSLQDGELSQPETSVRLNRSYVSESWSKDPFDKGFIIRQSIEERVPLHLRRIVIVVDTSKTMRAWMPDIAAAIASLPPDLDVKMVLANSDDLFESTSYTTPQAVGRSAILIALQRTTFAGGADNVPALIKAWDLAAEKPGNNAIVWIHNPQRVLLRSLEELTQRWDRRPYGPKLYSIQTVPGADEIAPKLEGLNEVKSVPRVNQLQADLENLFEQLTGQVKTLEFVRTSKRMNQQLDLSGAVEASDHLARLWASDEVARILTARDEMLNEAATTLAVRYQLVTPVSGAVVLETAEQYRAAGLQPVSPGSVPTIPEPEIMALLVIAGVFVASMFYFKYRKAGSGRCTV